jgi:hypothetical protein
MAIEMKKLRYRRAWLALGCLWIALVIFLSLTPSPPQPLGFPGEDKVGHVCAYGFLMFWFGLIYRPGKVYLSIGLGFVLMGIILECVQGDLGHRTFEWGDVTANLAGVLLGLGLSRTPLSGALQRAEGHLFRS